MWGEALSNLLGCHRDERSCMSNARSMAPRSLLSSSGLQGFKDPVLNNTEIPQCSRPREGQTNPVETNVQF